MNGRRASGAPSAQATVAAGLRIHRIQPAKAVLSLAVEQAKKGLLYPLGDRATATNPDLIPSTLRTGVISAAVPDMKISSARYSASRDNTCSRTSSPCACARVMIASRVIPGRAAEVKGGVKITPFFTINRFSPAPSDT